MTTTEECTAKIRAFIEEYGLIMSAEFVPYSIAKAKRDDWNSDPANPWKCLSWNITIKRVSKVEGSATLARYVLTTTYSMGLAHAPSYDQRLSSASIYKSTSYEDRRKIGINRRLLDWEIEHGKPARVVGFGQDTIAVDKLEIRAADNAKPIEPEFESVLDELSMDASILDEPGFEAWAASLGYDPDSRKAEKVYRACLEIALKLRAALGEDGLTALREACQDY